MLGIPTAAVLSFLTVAFITPVVIKRCRELGFLSEDLHKPGTMVPYLGGISILIGFLVGITATGFYGMDPKAGLAAALSGTLGGLIGLVDDLFKLNKRSLVLLSAMAGLPIVSFRVGSTVIYALGELDLGVLFWVLVPVGFCYLMNAVNIYAGFNGIEAGCGLVTSFFLMICSILYRSWDSAMELAALSGALAAFLLWNRYPSRIFPGNSGTYLMGAVLASSIVIGTIKTAGVIATAPYLINFLIRLRNRFTWTVGYVDDSGVIRTKGLEALWSLWIGKGSSEVKIFWKAVLFHSLFGIGAVLFSLASVDQVTVNS
jgi:UDP-N-acetylglucosamine--dolichyl-phosphate N-acetylglucosaminephosphotransferase